VLHFGWFIHFCHQLGLCPGTKDGAMIDEKRHTIIWTEGQNDWQNQSWAVIRLLQTCRQPEYWPAHKHLWLSLLNLKLVCLFVRPGKCWHGFWFSRSPYKTDRHTDSPMPVRRRATCVHVTMWHNNSWYALYCITCHMGSHSLTCMPPDTGERAPPQPQPDRTVFDLPTPEGKQAELVLVLVRPIHRLIRFTYV